MSTITIEYKTRHTHCNCCEQELKEPVFSSPLHWKFTLHDAMNYAPWEEFIDEIEPLVTEYVIESIAMFISSYANVIVENSEIQKVKQFILNNLEGSKDVFS